jgi:hypothetical protein
MSRFTFSSSPACWPLLMVLLAPVALLRAADSAEPVVPQMDAPPVPIVSSDEMVQKNLQTLNQYLDANPKLEDNLRTNIDQIDQPAFRRQNPAWDAYLKRQPEAAAALRAEKGFLLHRALARITRTRMMRRDVVALDAFLEAHPDILKPVQSHPRLLVDSNFLIAHPALGEFLQKHPSLSTALIESSAPKKKPDAAKK